METNSIWWASSILKTHSLQGTTTGSGDKPLPLDVHKAIHTHPLVDPELCAISSCITVLVTVIVCVLKGDQVDRDATEDQYRVWKAKCFQRGEGEQ